MFCLITYILFIANVGHLAKDHSVREEIHFCHFMDYYFQLAIKDLLCELQTG